MYLYNKAIVSHVFIQQSYCFPCIYTTKLLFPMYLYNKAIVSYVFIQQSYCFLCIYTTKLLFPMYLYNKAIVSYVFQKIKHLQFRRLGEIELKVIVKKKHHIYIRYMIMTHSHHDTTTKMSVIV
jgi:hypothetical protein